MTAELVLERLPSGDFAWLEPDTSTATYTPTQLGEDLVRREAAMQFLFGPAPTVAEACGLTRGMA